MRGEQDLLREKAEIAAGSPPLARGTVIHPHPLKAHHRITPACAGNRSRTDCKRHGVQDHPRLRGEQFRSKKCSCSGIGSPPLARGTALFVWDSALYCRITPACAGNRGLSTILSPSSRDHPRLRGEQLSTSACALRIAGSPPLARGTVGEEALDALGAGITPACAGNREGNIPRRKAARDHPRLRGEQSVCHILAAGRVGSPPLARGTVAFQLDKVVVRGITPACAGNSCEIVVAAPIIRDHPRLRGEQSVSASITPFRMGSPPLARGTAISLASRPFAARITPACAGNSTSSTNQPNPCWDHPRLRGEQRFKVLARADIKGSPPLARGTAAAR